MGHGAAVHFLKSIHISPRLELVYSNLNVELNAEAILTHYTDQDFSFVDAVSFVIMRERGIMQAFAFDHHFLISGFLLIPS